MCKHVTASSRRAALHAYGRYFDRTTQKFYCFSCGTALANPHELADVERRREEEFEAYKDSAYYKSLPYGLPSLSSPYFFD